MSPPVTPVPARLPLALSPSFHFHKLHGYSHSRARPPFDLAVLGGCRGCREQAEYLLSGTPPPGLRVVPRGTPGYIENRFQRRAWYHTQRQAVEQQAAEEQVQLGHGSAEAVFQARLYRWRRTMAGERRSRPAPAPAAAPAAAPALHATQPPPSTAWSWLAGDENSSYGMVSSGCLEVLTQSLAAPPSSSPRPAAHVQQPPPNSPAGDKPGPVTTSQSGNRPGNFPG